MIHSIHLPSWFSIACTMIISLQVLFSSLWIYAPAFYRMSDSYFNFYTKFIKAFTFQTATDYTIDHLLTSYICFTVAMVSLLWLWFVVLYEFKHYTIPKVFLFISVLIIDIIEPLFLIPSTYSVSHAIAALYYKNSSKYVIELIIGLISLITCSFHFVFSMFLKSRSVVLTNLTFQLYDPLVYIIWFALTSISVIFTVICKWFDSWFYILIVVIHILVISYLLYRVTFLPFPILWKNAVAFALGMTVVTLDVNYIIISIFKSFTYNYTIYVALVATVVWSVISHFAFKKKFSKLKIILTDEDDDKDELFNLFSQLKIGKDYHHTMQFLAVGMSEICDYFVDGTLFQFIMDHAIDEQTIALLLQVLTYFPAEYNKLNAVYKKLSSKPKLGFVNRFLIFQIAKIKSRRLVTNTGETNETVYRLRTLNDECRLLMRSFWEKTYCKSDFLSILDAKINDTGNYMEFILENNPNNIAINTEYLNFLSDISCEFDKAIAQSIRTDAISDGKNFNIDVCFRSVVTKFPRYIKDGVLDENGMKAAPENEDQLEDSPLTHGLTRRDSEFFDNLMLNPQMINLDTNSGENYSKVKGIDAEKEEFVANKLIKDSAGRLAFFNALHDSKPVQSYYIVIFSTLCVILQLVLFVLIFVRIRSTFDWRDLPQTSMLYSGGSTFFLQYSHLYSLLHWANNTGRWVKNSALLGNISMDPDEYILPEIDIKGNYDNLIFQTITVSMQFIKIVVDSIAEKDGILDGYQFAPQLIKQEYDFYECNDGVPHGTIKTSIKEKEIHTAMCQKIIVGTLLQNGTAQNIFQMNAYCNIHMNLYGITEIIQQELESMKNYSVARSIPSSKVFNFYLIFGITLSIVFSLIPISVLIYFFKRSLNKILAVLLSLPNNIKEQAKESIMVCGYVSSSAVDGKIEKRSRKWQAIINIIIIVAICLFILFSCHRGMNLNTDIANMDIWFYYNCKRFNLLSTVTNDALLLIILNGSIPQNITDRQTITTRIKKNLDAILKVNNILINGDGDIKPQIGFDAKLDELILENNCDLGRNPESIHDMYGCSSMNSILLTYRNFVNDIILDPDSFKGDMHNELVVNLIHMVEIHLYPYMLQNLNRITQIYREKYDEFVSQFIILVTIGAIASVVNFLFSMTYVIAFNQVWRTMLRLIQRLPPLYVASSQPILNYFKYHTIHNSDDDNEMPMSKSVVFNASQAIIITNQHGIIEIINPSVTHNFGLTPDQMLGQLITNFAPPEEKGKIISQIESMTIEKGSTFFQDHIQLYNEAKTEIPYVLTMIGMKDMDKVSSIVFILTNESDEIKKRIDAETAKAKSEKLLHQILPTDTVLRLNRGEKDITYTIPIATVFFVDIVKFSKYAANLTPHDIMANLSLVFSTFDGIVANYKSITKIKLIGDVYMAASGLFEDSRGLANKHAEDAVKCCCEIQKSMETINNKLDSNLEVRIGVNSGGPLIGGVLGSDKPAFDIIGDAINVAARLQSTDVPGKVQISRDTKELIACYDFIIEERGEIFLKGKGNLVTYLVSLPRVATGEDSNTLSLISGQLPDI